MLTMNSINPLHDGHSYQETRDSWINPRRHWHSEREMTLYHD